MKSYIALLRGINVSGQKKIKMVDLRKTLEENGFQTVETYIQSGNIVFQGKEQDKQNLQEAIHRAILNDFGFDVPTLVLTSGELDSILKENPFAQEPETKSLYYVLLKSEPQQDLVDEFNKLEFKNEDFHISKNCVYLCCKAGYGNAKLSNNLVEKKLKVEATARNFRTMHKLLEMVENTN